MSIYEMTNTLDKREALNNLPDSEKLKLIYELTDSKSIVELLEFVECAMQDAEWCQSYR